MFSLVRYAVGAVFTVVILWAFFFIPVGGRRTLWQHTQRIVGTQEAQDLGHDLSRAGHDVADRVEREVVPMFGARDGGAADASEGSMASPTPGRRRARTP